MKCNNSSRPEHKRQMGKVLEIDGIAIQLLIALISSLARGFVGYRFAIHSDKRKEYNELADPLFTKVNQTLEKLGWG